MNELELQKWTKTVGDYIEKHRPPLQVRNRLDLGFRIKEQSVEIFDIRPLYDNPDEKIEEMQAKATFIKKSSNWKVYWMRANSKWESYQPVPEVDTLEQFLELVSKDEHYCFRG